LILCIFITDIPVSQEDYNESGTSSSVFSCPAISKSDSSAIHILLAITQSSSAFSSCLALAISAACHVQSIAIGIKLRQLHRIVSHLDKLGECLTMGFVDVLDIVDHNFLSLFYNTYLDLKL